MVYVLNQIDAIVMVKFQIWVAHDYFYVHPRIVNDLYKSYQKLGELNYQRNNHFYHYLSIMVLVPDHAKFLMNSP